MISRLVCPWTSLRWILLQLPPTKCEKNPAPPPQRAESGLRFCRAKAGARWKPCWEYQVFRTFQQALRAEKEAHTQTQGRTRMKKKTKQLNLHSSWSGYCSMKDWATEEEGSLDWLKTQLRLFEAEHQPMHSFVLRQPGEQTDEVEQGWMPCSSKAGTRGVWGGTGLCGHEQNEWSCLLN